MGGTRSCTTISQGRQSVRVKNEAINAIGWEKPTAVQSLSIPVILQGRDTCASAATGSGKTGAFMLPILHRLIIEDQRIPLTKCVVLLPTRLNVYEFTIQRTSSAMSHGYPRSGSVHQYEIGSGGWGVAH